MAHARLLMTLAVKTTAHKENQMMMLRIMNQWKKSRMNGTIHVSRDPLAIRHGSLVIFLAGDGNVCDDRGQNLRTHAGLPIRRDVTLGRARVLKHKGKAIIGLVVKEKANFSMEPGICREAVNSLRDVVC